MKTHDDSEFQCRVQDKRIARMNAIDALSPDLRQCVYDFGYPVVKTCMDLGVVKPQRIRHLVETILDEFSPTRGTFSTQGIRKDVHTGKKWGREE